MMWRMPEAAVEDADTGSLQIREKSVFADSPIISSGAGLRSGFKLLVSIPPVPGTGPQAHFP